MVGFHRRGHTGIGKWGHAKGAVDKGRRQSSISDEEGDAPSATEVDEKVSSSSQETVARTPTDDMAAADARQPLKVPDEGAKTKPRRDGPPTDLELMREKFARLLLGEDMSGGSTGVSSALALSNAITNLAASVFGEQSRLEPMAPERKARWRKEVDWLLSVNEHIVEFLPSKQVLDDGKVVDIMITQQRRDLRMNIPALRKLDGMLIEYLDNFKQKNEFWYVHRDASEAEKGSAKRTDDKWWLPTVRVPPNGLSEDSRRFVQNQKELVNQVLKAAMAINANVLMEMEIPEDYIDNLPKNGRSSLGDSLYKSITDDDFDADAWLSSADLSNEHKIVDLKNRIEASVVIWKRKMTKDSKSSWGSGISMEKREQFEDRAETMLLILKHRFPGIPQSTLDISKIQYNKDVGFSILESYSRVLESLAFTVVSRIEDVLRADALAVSQNPNSKVADTLKPPPTVFDRAASVKLVCSPEEAEPATAVGSLPDGTGWQVDQANIVHDEEQPIVSNEDDEQPLSNEPLNIMVSKKFVDLWNLENNVEAS